MSEKEDLLGDKVQRGLEKLGADKVAKQIEKVTKKPCGCGRRTKQLNNLNRAFIRKRRRVIDKFARKPRI